MMTCRWGCGVCCAAYEIVAILCFRKRDKAHELQVQLDTNMFGVGDEAEEEEMILMS